MDGNVFETHKMKVFGEFLRGPRIRTVSLNYCKIGDEGGVLIGEALRFASSIKDLRAKCNEFRDATAKAIAEALEDNCTI